MNKAHCTEWSAYTSATGFAHMRSIVHAYGLIWNLAKKLKKEKSCKPQAPSHKL